VEDLYDIIEEIFGEDGKGERSTIVFGDWGVVGDKSYWNIAVPRGLGRRNQFTCASTFVKEMELSSPTHGFKNPREDPTHGKQQEMEFDTSWSIYM
jgi:hypothetical protein